MINVYLDDMRNAPFGWVKVSKVESVIDLLINNEVENLSLDHDLGSNLPTGYDLVKLMAEKNLWPKYKPTVHSNNPVGVANMKSLIDRYGPY